MIISFRTDKPEAEIALFDNEKKIDEIIWQAHRELGNTIHKKIDELLTRNNLELNNLTGIVCFKGPGSFTGLRIGLTVANTMAMELSIPIVGAMGADWQAEAIKKINSGENQELILPEYGQDPQITKQKK